MKNLLLPQHINMLRVSEQASNFHGSLLIKDMQRLAPSLYSEEGEVTVDLELGKDEEEIPFCRVKLNTEVVLQCQRCMEPFKYGIMSDFLHGVVSSEREAEALAGHYEPVIVEDGMLIVQNVVEDELILKLPIVAMHPEADCKVRLPMADSGWKDEKEEVKNPFQVLRLLKPETK